MKTGGYTLVMLVVFCSSMLADEFKLASMKDVQSAFETQQQELAQLRARLATFEQQDFGPVPATPASYGTTCGDSCGGKGGGCGGAWLFSTDLLVFTAKHNDLDAATGMDAKAGYRLTLARDDGCGNGMRVRYMNWDASGELDDDTATIQLGVLDIETVDLEWYTTCDICCGSSLELSAGLRYIDYFESFSQTMTAPNQINHTYGFGPVAGITARRCITDGISLYGLVRESIVAVEGNCFNTDIENQIALISELQFGAEVTSCTAYGTVFGRAALEGQHYSGIGRSESFDAGLFGLSFSVGLSR